MDAAETRITTKHVLLLVAALIAAPAAAQAQQAVLVVSSTTISLGNNNQAQQLQVTSSQGSSAPLSFSVGAAYTSGLNGWFNVLNSQGTSAVGQTFSTPATIYIQLAIANPGSGTTGSITLTDLTDTPDSQTVTVNYVPGGTGGNGTVTANPSSVTLSTSPNNSSQVSASISLSTSSTTTVTGQISLSGSSTYLALSTNTFAVSSGVPNNFTLIGVAGTPAGTYSATILVNPNNGSGTLQIPVTYTSGSGTSANPSSFTLAYPGGPFSQGVTVTSSGGQFYSSASSSSGWLLVNGAYSTNYIASGSVITISVNTSIASSLGTGTYQGNVQLYGADSTQGTITVTLSVNGSSTGVVNISPASVVISVPAGTTATQASSVSLTTTTSNVSYSASPSTGNGVNWLSLSQYGGVLNSGNQSNNLTLYVNPSILGSGTYYGTVSLSYSGGYIGSAQINVQLNIGTNVIGTGGLVAPSSLTFYYQISGGTQNLSSSILVNSSGTITATSSQSWLTASPSGNGTQQTVAVAVTPQGMAAGNYSGQISISTPSGTTSVPVTLTVTSSMVATTYPATFQVFSWVAGTANPQTGIYVYTSDGSAQTVTATTSAGWIVLTPPANPTTVASYGLTLNPAGLPNGLNTGTVTFSVTNAADTQWVVPVAIIVSGSTTGGGGALNFSASSLVFNTTVGGSAASQSLTVTSSTASTFTVSANSSGWLSVSPANQTLGLPASLTVSVNTAGLSANAYNGSLNFLSNGLSQSVPVTMTLSGSGSGGSGLSPSPASLQFAYTAGGSVPGSQTINVQSTTGGSVAFTASASTSSGGSWLSLNVGPNQALATPSNNFLTASISPTGLAGGTYSGNIALASQTGTINIPVTLTVTGAPPITVSPTTLSFSYTAGGSAPASQSLSVSGTGSFTAVASSSGSWLSVIGGTGTAPATVIVSVNPTGLTAGSYNGSIAVTGTNGTSGSTTVTVTLVVTAPLPTITQISNAASYSSGAISPGELITIFGTSLGPATPVGLTLTSTGAVSTNIGNVQVLVNGIACPLIYVSGTQISAVVPYAVAVFQTAQVYVNFLGQTSNAVQESVATTAPGIFTANSSGTGPGAIANQNFSPNSPSNPAALGSVVTLYLTGEGQTSPAGVTGSVTQALASPPYTPAPLLPVAVLINNAPAAIQFAGEAPGIVAGVLQVNVVIPAGTPAGAVPVSVSIGGKTTQNGVTVSVQ
jgi:uncharacterized protein (TIGR03437 family)